VSSANPNMISSCHLDRLRARTCPPLFRWGSFHSPQPTWLIPVVASRALSCSFHPPRSRRRASQGKSGAASLVFEPEGEAEYSWKSGGLPCRRTGAPRIGAPRVHMPGELGERRFSREAQEGVGGSGRRFLSSISFGRTKEMEPRVQGRSYPQLAFKSQKPPKAVFVHLLPGFPLSRE